MWIKLLPYIIGALLIGGVLWKSYDLGYDKMHAICEADKSAAKDVTIKNAGDANAIKNKNRALPDGGAVKQLRSQWQRD